MGQPKTRSIPKPQSVAGLSPSHVHLLDSMREAIIDLQGQTQPPRQPTNLAASALPGGIQIQWSTTDADFYQVWFGTTPNLGQAAIAGTSFNNQYQDIFGAAAVKRFYWVYAVKFNGKQSIPAGPAAATSGALGTGVTPPKAPFTGDQLVTDAATGFARPRGPLR